MKLSQRAVIPGEAIHEEIKHGEIKHGEVIQGRLSYCLHAAGW